MKVKSKIFYWYAAFVIAVAALTLLPAPDRATLAKYHLTANALRSIDITFIIIEAVIWFAAFYGYEKLYRYSQLIKKTKEGKQIAKLARGLMLLAIGLPISSIVSGILSLFAAHDPSFKSAANIISNYFGIVFPLAAFMWISLGARSLGEVGKTRPRLLMLNVVALIVIALGVVFCSLLVLDHTELRRAYHMSPELAMLTLAIPYMYMWFLGLFSIAELITYSHKVAGIVYRRGWNLLIGGFGFIILFSILLQYLTTLTNWLTSLSLGGVLLLLYVLLFLWALAYIVVALGAKQLTKIEEA